MSRVRYEFAGRLVTLAPLHIGSGEFRRVDAVEGNGRTKETPEVAAIVRDALRRPYIPGTAIKGLLRRLAEAMPGDDLDGCHEELFGLIKRAPEDAAAQPRSESDEYGSMGLMGALLCRGAELIGPPPDVREAPFADHAPAGDDGGKLGAGIFIAARTRIDPATGTAHDSTLFFQEMVAPGAEFAFRCTIDLRRNGAAERGERLTAALIGVLNHLTAEAGEAIGKGQADGFGRVRLDPKLTIWRYALDSSGKMVPTDATALWNRRKTLRVQPENVVLTLSCDGPFIIVDGSHASRTVRSEAHGDSPQVQAQRVAAGVPLVLGSSISGALRSRARWLAALEAHRRGAAAPVECDRMVLQLSDIDSLSAVERLFGCTGFRGLLEIEMIGVPEAEPWRITSVKLDRFSGAPIDNALFTTDTFAGVCLTMQLRLTNRGKAMPRDEDRKLFEALLSDIRRNGLQIGYGGNRGFGWFSLEGARDG